jgi:hypothetical protein
MEGCLQRIEALEGVVQEMGRSKQRADAQLRLWRMATCALVGLMLVVVPLQVGTAQGDADSKLQAFLQHLVVENDGADIIIRGANLHIQNGTGATDQKNGTGNLIVGYNPVPTEGTVDRSGSHNVVIGPRHTYSSYGGLVVGEANNLAGPWSFVAGGTGNQALRPHSTVSGGKNNAASGDGASVSGGSGNTASGDFATVTGGQANGARGTYSTVCGGENNVSEIRGAAVVGGNANKATGEYSAVLGGSMNEAKALLSTVCGGRKVVNDERESHQP